MIKLRSTLLKHFALFGALLVMIPGAEAFSDQIVRCESQNNSRSYCRVDNTSQYYVRLHRQLSKTACREGDSWGVATSDIWVDKGCRAEFRLEPRPGAAVNNNQAGDKCPPNAQPGRCTKRMRKKGCKDFRTPSGLGCYTFR